jgi:hypothetical protein
VEVYSPAGTVFPERRRSLSSLSSRFFT